MHTTLELTTYADLSQVRGRRADYYSSGTSWGAPVAATMYDLALQLHMDSPHFLW